jgi:hypothetical protein
MNNWLIPSAVGLVVAAVITSVFQLHSNKIDGLILGGKTANVIEATITSIFVFSIAIMIWFSVTVRDMKFPRANPIRFTIEVLAASFLPSLFIFLLYYLRQVHINRYTMAAFLLLSLKFGLVHILFQFSGIYSTYLR